MTIPAHTVPAPVADLCDRFLDIVPDGLVTGLYLRGGIGFGEWVEGQSDVDFVATLAHRPNDAEIEVLRLVHERMAAYSSVPFDGMHVLASDLAADPRALPPVPVVLEGRFDVGRIDQLIAWHDLASHGVTMLGPPLARLDVWTDDDILRAFTVDNLDTYWRGWAERLRALPDEAPHEWICQWCVLGVARLHHLLVTGEMTSKSRAGRWGLKHYPDRWHRVLREALRIRDGGEEEYADDPAARRADTAAFTAYIVEQGAGRAI